MSRYLSVQLAMALMLCASPVFAQAKATAQNVPEIPYDSVPNFFKFEGACLRLHAQRQHAPVRVRSERRVRA